MEEIKIQPMEKPQKKFNLGGRPVAFKTPQEMIDKMEQYFEEQSKFEFIYYDKLGNEKKRKLQAPIHIAGLCAFLGITNETLNQYAKKKGFSESISRAKKICEAYLVDQCIIGQKGNKADFVLKNNYPLDWKEKVESEVSGKDGVPLTVMIRGYKPEE